MYRKDSQYISSEDVYFEIAPIVNNKPGAAVPLSDRAALTLSSLLSSSAKREVGGFVPLNMLYSGFVDGKPCIMWYTKPGKRKLIFDDHLTIPSGYVNLPWIVWYVRGSSLILHMCTEKPTMSTKLYRAPFHNTSKDGTVCLGSGWKLLGKEFTSFDALMANTEAAFFSTKFTHSNHNAHIKGNINSMYKSLVNTDKKFPMHMLVDTKKTIYSYITNKEEIPDEPIEL